MSHLNVDYLNRYGAGKIFIETGTYKGETVQIALNADYNLIHSIELNEDFYHNCVKMFEGDDRVKIWFGDSIDVLSQILAQVNEPTTFWLDAHASGPLPGGRSGGSPLLDELDIIKAHHIKEHTIFIDDKRLFGSAEWGGIKIEQAMQKLMEINPSYKFYLLDGQVEKDVIVATLR